jgi:hypothetical protein
MFCWNGHFDPLNHYGGLLSRYQNPNAKNIGNFTTLLKPHSIGTHLKGIETSFHVVPLFFKSFHFWVSYITFWNVLKILSYFSCLSLQVKQRGEGIVHVRFLRRSRGSMDSRRETFSILVVVTKVMVEDVHLADLPKDLLAKHWRCSAAFTCTVFIWWIWEKLFDCWWRCLVYVDGYLQTYTMQDQWTL